MKDLYLPEAHNDFTFALVGEADPLLLLAAALIFAVLLLKFFSRKK